MLDITNLLRYYLTSSEWKMALDNFFEYTNHVIPHECQEPEPEDGSALVSDIYLTYREKEKTDGDFPQLALTNEEFQKYFSSQFSEKQRFAVVFGLWWGLLPEQIRCISEKKHKSFCICWLDYFLCNPDAMPAELSSDELRCPHYQGAYQRLYPVKINGLIYWDFSPENQGI